MPLKQIEITQNHRVAIWHITEDMQELENMVPDTFRLHTPKEQRNKQWMASRLLLSEMFDHAPFVLLKEESGKPYLDGHSEGISISHSGEYAAVIVSARKDTGIDIEKLDRRIYKIAHKFLNDYDRKFLQGEDDLLGYYLIWNAKEVMFKYYSKGSVDFRKHLHVDLSRRNENLLMCSIDKDTYQVNLQLKFKIIGDDFLLTWINHED